MTKPKKKQKATCKHLMYSIIEYFAGLIEYEFDVSSYLLNKNKNDLSDIEFSRRNITNFIARNNNNKSDNRLCLVISINDKNLKDIEQSHNLLKELFKKIKKDFWQSEIFDILENYDPEAIVKMLSTENHTTLVDYIIIVFNLPKDSSVEIILSTNRLSKKNIRRDEDGEPIDYNSKLYTDINKFEEERKRRKNF